MSLPTPHTGPRTCSIPDPSDFKEFEGPLIELAQRSGGDLRKLLTAFFGFLHRRTDFYCIPPSDSSSAAAGTMGFKEGDAEKFLLAAFRQFPLRKVPTASATKNHPTPAKESRPTGVTRTRPKKADSVMSNTAESIEPALAKTTIIDVSKPTTTDAKTRSATGAVVRRTEEGLQIPIGNGGSTEKYKWTQTLEECTVLLGIPEGLRGKDLAVAIEQNILSVQSKAPIGEDIEITTFVGGSLTHRIVPDESTWTLEGGVLQVTLYKHQKMFWETILEGDDKIDTTLVDSRRNISSYDEATQAQIRRIMFDQQQHSKGIPTGKPAIPDLPPGVEYIDQEILKEKTGPTDK